MTRSPAARRIKITTAVNVAVLAAFALLFLARRNYEFIVYASSLVVAIALIELTDRTFAYPRLARVSFTVWMCLHLAGGAFRIHGTRIYDTILVPLAGDPYDILRYDQVIHAFCYFVVTLFMVAIVRRGTRPGAGRLLTGVIAALAAMGVSALNEVMEFATVVFFGAEGVGGYYNNALDLVFNLAGILLAIAVSAITEHPHAQADAAPTRQPQVEHDALPHQSA